MENKYDQISEFIADFVQIYSNFSKKWNFNYNELRFLYYVNSHHDASLSGIIQKWGMPKQTVNSIRNKFIKDELITVGSDPNDHRKRVVNLTSKGKIAVSDMFSVLDLAEQKASTEISEDEFRMFIKICKKMRDSLADNLQK